MDSVIFYVNHCQQDISVNSDLSAEDHCPTWGQNFEKGKKRFLSHALIPCCLRKQLNSTRSNDGAWHNICLVWSSTGGRVTFQKDKIRLTGYGFFEGKIIPGKYKMIDFTNDLCVLPSWLVVAPEWIWRYHDFEDGLEVVEKKTRRIVYHATQ